VTSDADPADRLDALASLGDPVRRRLFRYVFDGAAPMSRDEVAAGTEVTRSTAAYHLEKLVEVGLLGVRFERRTGRRGPGAGRPTKLYLRPAASVAVSLPRREYELMAVLLAGAVEQDSTGTARRALYDAARAAGADLARTDGRRTAREVLAAAGYEPRIGPDGIWLRNCPFERLAVEHRDLVCGASLALVEGVVDVAGEPGERAVLAPGPQRCCVLVRAA
jgi:predicted ArsR family transcriptional regulator